MRLACELMHKSTGASKVVVVRLPKEEAGDARRQGHAMLPCAKGYAVRQAQKLNTDFRWVGGPVLKLP
jgi:hypothetical protein